MMRLGRLELWPVNDGEFRLDGGAMFGVVPRVLWERAKPADERHRIRMATGSLLVRSGASWTLIDTGIGDKNDEAFRDRFGMREDSIRLPQRLLEAGVGPEEIDHVLLTHLHFDHCGWNTRFEDGRLVPTFARARYWLARGEVEHARHPNERDRASYDPRNWEPLFAAGVAELFEDEAEPVPGVRAVRASGHTADMCVVLLDGGDGARGVFFADLIPTAAHVAYPWIMSYDLYPLETLANKKLWVPRAAEGGWLCFFQHDPDVPVGRLVEETPGRFRARSL